VVRNLQPFEPDIFAEELVLVMAMTPQWPSGLRFGFEVHVHHGQVERLEFDALARKLVSSIGSPMVSSAR
jgi:hypothetical protein